MILLHHLVVGSGHLLTECSDPQPFDCLSPAGSQCPIHPFSCPPYPYPPLEFSSARILYDLLKNRPKSKSKVFEIFENCSSQDCLEVGGTNFSPFDSNSLIDLKLVQIHPQSTILLKTFVVNIVILTCCVDVKD